MKPHRRRRIKGWQANQETRRQAAKERQEYWDSRTLEQKLEALDLRLGEDIGAKKQRARIAEAMLEEQVAAWHSSSTKMPLSEWLGMTQEQYATWVETTKLPTERMVPVKPKKKSRKRTRKKEAK